MAHDLRRNMEGGLPLFIIYLTFGRFHNFFDKNVVRHVVCLPALACWYIQPARQSQQRGPGWPGSRSLHHLRGKRTQRHQAWQVGLIARLSPSAGLGGCFLNPPSRPLSLACRWKCRSRGSAAPGRRLVSRPPANAGSVSLLSLLLMPTCEEGEAGEREARARE